MKDPLNSSIFRSFANYLRSLTWERGLVVLFAVLIVCELAVLVCSKYLYDKLNERTPIYVQCDEISRREQMLELRNYIASSTEKSKSNTKADKGGSKVTKSKNKQPSKSKTATTSSKSTKKGTP